MWWLKLSIWNHLIIKFAPKQVPWSTHPERLCVNYLVSVQIQNQRANILCWASCVSLDERIIICSLVRYWVFKQQTASHHIHSFKNVVVNCVVISHQWCFVLPYLWATRLVYRVPLGLATCSYVLPTTPFGSCSWPGSKTVRTGSFFYPWKITW